MPSHRALDPTVDLAEAFRHRATRKVHRDSTVTLDGVLFELPSTLIGERVVLRYDPTWPPANRRLFVTIAGASSGEARLVDSYANARVRRADLRLDPQTTMRRTRRRPGGALRSA